jgi:hypothetical protein
MQDPGDAASVFTIKTSHYLIAGMSLATALSWNEAVKKLINNTYPMPNDTLRAVVIYSLVMTLILILIIWFLPDTKAELPLDTQHRIHMAEIAKHRREMNRLQSEIARLNMQELENY